MGVYIKGMEMPKSGTYEVSIDNTNGKDKTIMSMFVRGNGRLIDADAIPYNKIMLMDDDFYYGVTKPYIDRMPTIIEAEEGE